MAYSPKKSNLLLLHLCLWLLANPLRSRLPPHVRMCSHDTRLNPHMCMCFHDTRCSPGTVRPPAMSPNPWARGARQARVGGTGGGNMEKGRRLGSTSDIKTLGLPLPADPKLETLTVWRARNSSNVTQIQHRSSPGCKNMPSIHWVIILTDPGATCMLWHILRSE